MALVPGASHTIAGSGQIGLAGPAGLQIDASNIPPHISAVFGPPRTYRPALVRFAWGDDDSLYAVRGAHLQNQQWADLPPGLTRLQFTCLAGVTATVTELVGDIVVNTVPATIRGRGLVPFIF
ncbi:MAG TPA: hypothetical protein VGQ62_12950 [Chloroflexota bacterium]|nr:hypothetical protein [Chloroflexota bacterium]